MDSINAYGSQGQKMIYSYKEGNNN